MKITLKHLPGQHDQLTHGRRGVNVQYIPIANNNRAVIGTVEQLGLATQDHFSAFYNAKSGKVISAKDQAGRYNLLHDNILASAYAADATRKMFGVDRSAFEFSAEDMNPSMRAYSSPYSNQAAYDAVKGNGIMVFGKIADRIYHAELPFTGSPQRNFSNLQSILRNVGAHPNATMDVQFTLPNGNKANIGSVKIGDILNASGVTFNRGTDRWGGDYYTVNLKELRKVKLRKF